MLLNTWLATAKRHLLGSAPASGSRRSGPSRKKRVSSCEQLESRTLLTALVINTANVDDFVDATGTLSVTNSDLGTHDTLVIEDVSINSTGDGISIDLSGITLTRLALESIDVNAFNGAAIDINLTNIVGTTRTIALEDIRVVAGTGSGIDLTLDNSDAFAVTVEDSFVPSVAITANNNADITHGIITENQIVAPSDVTGVLLNVTAGSTADDFQIINNREISALNRDAVLVNLVDAPVDGLNISNNVIGNEPGADVSFRAEGDTFIQPFELKNNASDGELLTQFMLDLRPLGLVFETNTYQPVNNTGAATGASAGVLSDNNQVLTISFNTDVANPTFAPGDSLLFVVDVDAAPAIPGDPSVDLSVFGRDLIGALVDFSFGPGLSSGPKQVAGAMIGDASEFNASFFARGAGAAANFHGINLNLTNSPLTNAIVSNNMISGVAGHGVLVDAQQQSDVSAVFRDNVILSGGQDGLRFDLLDSNFTGGVVDNTIGNNSGHGVNFQPSVSRTGLVEAAIDGNPVLITSTNHQLQTGDEIIIQGMVNDDPTVNHPGNGQHTVTRIDNNTFSLQGVTGLPANVDYVGGGAWYVPNILVGGMARGLVEIDLQATEPQGRIQTIVNPGGGGDVQLTSLAHGLATGDRVRVSGAVGTLISGIQVFNITVIDNDTFSLDGAQSGGTYDTSGGLATWTTNVIEGASSTGEVVVTSVAHGLATGEQVRVVNVSLVDDSILASANGTWTVTRLTDDTFSLQGSTANGAYRLGTGYWIPLAEATFTGDSLPQIVAGNSITENNLAGFYVNLTTGTRFDGDIVSNTVTGNKAKGLHIVSHSFGLGTGLPLDPTDPNAVPEVQDISFNVNIGTATTDGNHIENNVQAGIVVEALDFATGSFEIQGNRINSNDDDNNSSTPYQGDGIVVRLASDLRTAEAIAFLTESIIADNQIGVDNRGNEGHGLSFSLTDRTKIHDLEINSNSFLNSGLDGFHFVRTEDGDLNKVIFDDNDATNNAGDGFDLFAENTVKDRLDFTIGNSRIDNNGEYGIRIDIQADARIDVDISGSSVRKNGASAVTNGNGFNPADGAGAAGAAGGIGIHGFQQVDIRFTAVETVMSENFGDGFSVDAEVFFDTVYVDATFVDSDLNGNTLTGLRSVGAAFGTYTWTRTDFVGNGTDGARIISNIDPNDLSLRRVGGQDIDVIALGSDFQLNGQSGLVLGQGVSASLGSGDVTENFANEFGGRLDADRSDYGVLNSLAGNGEDGLKIVQDAGTYLRGLGLRRVIETQGNTFTYNTGDGIDIGHHVATEAGNVLHGEEVVSDTHVSVTGSVISNNGGDGIEYLADSVLRIRPDDGGGQDGVSNPDISSLSVSTSDIKNNGQRGIDILNRYNEDSRITLYENEIIGNGYSGVYVVNTSSHDQRQSGPTDPLVAEYYNEGAFSVFRTDPNGYVSLNTGERDANIELRVQDNLIESNGTAAVQARVPVNFTDEGPGKSSG
ncbi:MAG: right-handed parallel beta-helix repeat-containing protein, partial [Fuerstiella sp.]